MSKYWIGQIDRSQIMASVTLDRASINKMPERTTRENIVMKHLLTSNDSLNSC